MDTEHPPTSRPGRCRLTLTINGLHYTVVSQDDVAVGKPDRWSGLLHVPFQLQRQARFRRYLLTTSCAAFARKM